MSEKIDALVVGARCAGAPLAAMLARAGKRTIVVDANDMPSDQPMSTHFIGTYGMAVLDELGVKDDVYAIAPPVRQFLNGADDVVAWIEFPRGREPSCPRRTELDALLVEHARKAGADVQLRTKLVDVVREGERVVGGVVEHAGEQRTIRCDVLVGADGRHSKVARLVGAGEYRGYDAPRDFHWAYWKKPSWYADDARYRGGAAVLHVGDECHLVFPANDDQLLIGFSSPRGDAEKQRGRASESYLERARSWEFTRPLCEGEPISKVIGFVKGRYFFREGAGKGWALVGDAGLFKDPTPGLGISDALRDARSLSRAIVEGTDEALVKYWRERDVASLELFEFAKNLGTPGYNNPLNRAIFAQLAKHAELRARLIQVVDRKMSPFAAFKTGEIVGWTLMEVLRGRFGVVRPFFAAGKKGAAIAKELEACKALARQADDAAAAAQRARPNL